MYISACCLKSSSFFIRFRREQSVDLVVYVVLFVKMAAPEEKQLYDVAPSQCLHVDSTSSDNAAQASSDSPDQPSQCLDVVCTPSDNAAESSGDSTNQPDKHVRCILAKVRDKFKINFDQIVADLSDKSLLNAAVTEREMYNVLQPVLERRRLTRMFLTPRQDKKLTQTLPIYSQHEQLSKATSHLERVGPICFTGCCSPSLTMDKKSLGLIQRYRSTLRLGDRVKCIVKLQDSYVDCLHLKVVKSTTCKEHPLQLIDAPLHTTVARVGSRFG